MNNVLPDIGRAEVRKEYWFRLATLVCLMLTALVLVGCVALLPTYLGQRSKKEALVKELAFAEESLQKELQSSVGQELASAENARVILTEAIKSPRPSAYVREVVGVQEVGVDLTRLEFSAGESVSMRIGGEASVRNDLIGFARRLEHITPAPKVDLPTATLAKSAEVPFIIMLRFDHED